MTYAVLLIPPAFFIAGILLILNRVKNIVAGFAASTALIYALSVSVLLFAKLVLKQIGLPLEFLLVSFDIGRYDFAIGTYLDGISVAGMVAVAVLAAASFFYFFGLLNKSKKLRSCIGIFFVMTGAIFGVLSSRDIISLFIFWWIFSVCFFILLKINSGKKSVFLNTVLICEIISAVTVFGCFYYLFSKTGTLSFTYIYWQAFNGYLSANFILKFGIFLVIIFFLKNAHLVFMGLYRSSMKVHSFLVIIAVVFFAPLNFFVFLKFYPVLAGNSKLMGIIALLGILAAIFLAVLAWSARKTFGVALFSGLSCVAFSFSSLASGVLWQGVFSLTAGMLSALVIILCLQTIYSKIKTSDLKRISSISYFMPVTCLSFWVGSLSLVGFFPFFGFFASRNVFTSFYVMQSDIYIAVILFFWLTIFYQTRFMVRLFYGRRKLHHKKFRQEGNFYALSTQIFVCFILFFGGFALSHKNIFENIVTRQSIGYGHYNIAHINAIFISVIVVGIVLAVYFYTRKETAIQSINKRLTGFLKFTKFVTGA